MKVELHLPHSLLVEPVNPTDLVRLEDLSNVEGGRSWTFTEDDFTAPAVNATVQIEVEDTRWMDIGAPLFIAGNTYAVASVDSDTEVTIRRLAMPTGGAGGGLSTVTVQFTPPAVASTVQVSVDSTEWMAEGAPLFIAGATYIVDTVDSATEVTLERVA